MSRVLVTGGYGYIGAHTVEALAKAGHNVDVLDYKITENDISKYIGAHLITDLTTFNSNLEYDCVVHLAAAIAVGDSVKYPSLYYKTNIVGTINLLENVQCGHFIFASTGAVTDPKSPYALSKLAGEDVVRELNANNTILRFYNVAGSNGVFKPQGQPTHLITLTAMAAAGIIPYLSIYGRDYDTKDGTCIRDYIHVEDVAQSIVSKVSRGPSKHKYENLGSGIGHSNFQITTVMKDVTNKNFMILFEPRRPGDAPILLADVLEENKPTKTIEDICLSTYNSLPG